MESNVLPFTGNYVSDRRNGVELPDDDEFQCTMYPVMPGHPMTKILEGVGDAVRGLLKLEEVHEAHPDLIPSLGSVSLALRDINNKAAALLDDIEARKWKAALKLEDKSCD